MRGLSSAAGPRLLPVVMVGLALFALARAADLWIGFSSAGAEDAPPAAAEAPAPVARAESSDPLDLHLADRRAELDRREAALETREAVLKATEARIEARLAELDARDKSAAAAEAGQEAEEKAQLNRLSDAYERMKPRDAARIFETLDAELLGPVAGGMRTQSLAAVMGEMDAGKAKALTELLARRKAVSAGEAPAP